MKILLMAAIIGFSFACNHEKNERAPAPLFKEGTAPIHSYRNAADNRPAEEKAKEMMNIQVNLQQNNIPVQVPNENYPTWQSYHDLLGRAGEQITDQALQFCRVRMLEAYKMYNETYEASTAGIIKPILTKMVSNQYLFELVFCKWRSCVCKQHEKKHFVLCQNFFYSG
jgi:hypothetical protein